MKSRHKHKFAARSQVELAAALDVGQPWISRSTRDPDWPVSRRGPWTAADIAKARAWMDDRRHAAGIHGEMTDAEIESIEKMLNDSRHSVSDVDNDRLMAGFFSLDDVKGG